MANEEHLEILRQGVEVWNRWREENPDIRPDLRKANLSGVDLRRAHLRGADFIMANLRGADLSGADLSGAYLSGADLSVAHLREADLSGVDLIMADLREADLHEADLLRADLVMADLSGADLSGADLFRTYLRGADLSEADLSGSLVGGTVFADLDLSVVEGLESILHAGPSTIGIDTIYRSGGKIPEVFLQGAGLPDTIIAYITSLRDEAIHYYSCFISYSSQDEDFAQRLHADLQQNAVRCWFAPEDMKIGDKIRVRIDESIRIHDKLLLVLSQHSVASQWVEHEVEHALDLERERGAAVLFPIRLDDTVMESKVGWAGNIRRTRHIGDFSRWKDHDSYQQAFDRLLHDLKAEE